VPEDPSLERCPQVARAGKRLDIRRDALQGPIAFALAR
jgi:hypothetical protein